MDKEPNKFGHTVNDLLKQRDELQEALQGLYDWSDQCFEEIKSCGFIRKPTAQQYRIFREKSAAVLGLRGDNQMNQAKYRMHDSKTGNVLINQIVLPKGLVEALSRDNAEGHFRAGSLHELVAAGIDDNQTVYALPL